MTLFALLMLIVVTAEHHKADAMGATVLQLGSKGREVSDLQFRLQTLGYFKANLSTHYGTETRDAVKRFQKEHGLTLDGVAGSRTWSKLKKLTVSQKELSMLARVIYGEARGESYKGQVAVGAVVMNRLHSSKFPDTLKGIIMQPNAFTAVTDGQYWLIPDDKAFQAARDAVRGWDPTGNALFYYNPDVSESVWFKTRTVLKRIGNHLFTL